MAEDRSQFQVVWTTKAVDRLTVMIEDARHAEGNPDWVERKLDECLREGVKRLTAFPDLRARYYVNEQWCNAFALRAFPVQLFFRQAATRTITIFTCRWARQDMTGPQR